MTETYALRYEITASGMTDASRLQQSKFMEGYRIVMAIVIALGVVIAVGVDFSFGLNIVLLGALLLAMTWMEFLDRWLYRNRGRGIVGGTAEWTVDGEGIRYKGPLGSGILAWPALTHVRSNDKSIIFGRDRVLAAYIPTTAFASRAERDSFLEFARAHVGKPVP
jgi:hypothetical protein